MRPSVAILVLPLALMAGCSPLQRPEVTAKVGTSRASSWPFKDPKNLAVITTRSILRGGRPILLVSHDKDDGSWQFLDGDTPRMQDAMVVALHEIAERDPSVAALADLPLGWQSWRDSPTSAWRRGRHP